MQNEGWQTLVTTIASMACATWALVAGVITQDAWWPVMGIGTAGMALRAVGQKVGGSLAGRGAATPTSTTGGAQ